MDKLHEDKVFKWNQSMLGGGGYITGILQNPADPDILYSRCDVAGVFKSLDGGRTWIPKNNGMELCHHHSVQSFCMGRRNPKVLFRCSGEARGHRLIGSIHKSVDAGESWTEVCDGVDYYGNGPTRMYGEVIDIDPFDDKRVITGGYSKGIWLSLDEGESWDYKGLKGQRFSCVYFHPRLKNCIFGGTVSDEAICGKESPEAELDKLHDFRREGPGRLYRSLDGGESWELVFEGASFSQIVFDPVDTNILYAACMENGILKSVDLGGTWERSMLGLPGDIGYITLAVGENVDSPLYTIPDLRGEHRHLDPIALYVSHNRGNSWSLVKEHDDKDLSLYPDYMTIRHAGWAVSKLKVDNNRLSKLYMCNWYGVSISEDNGRSWCGNYFMGTETTCMESVVCDPKANNRVYITMADHAPSVSMDNGKTFKPFAGCAGYNSSTAILASRYEELVVYGMRGAGGGSAIFTSRDNGRISELSIEFEEGLFVEALAEDYFEEGTLYALVDGELDRGAGLYRSADLGKSWRLMDLRFPRGISTLPHKKYWIEGELLSVVVYQIKNACGTNQLLCCDPHRRNTLYLGEWTEGLFVYTGDGEALKNIGTHLPFGRNKASVLNCIRVDENRPGVLYAGFIREGLWRSMDFGESWHKIFPLDGSIFNATSIAINRLRQEEIFVACEPLYWSNCKSSVWYSGDFGTSWEEVSSSELGAIRWKGIALEGGGGMLHGVSCGNGSFYAERVY